MHKKQREIFENNSKCITALHRCTQYFVLVIQIYEKYCIYANMCINFYKRCLICIAFKVIRSEFVDIYCWLY